MMDLQVVLVALAVLVASVYLIRRALFRLRDPNAANSGCGKCSASASRLDVKPLVQMSPPQKPSRSPAIDREP